MYVLTGVVAWGEEENGRRGGGWRGDVWTGRLAFEMEVSPAGSLAEHGTGWGC
jgi:hypothetical protein